MRRRYLLSLLTVGASACLGADQEKIWREYLDWYRKQPDSVSAPRKAYLDHLKRSGVGKAELEERSKIIERLSLKHREELQPVFFDRTYANPAPRFNTQPNALLAETVRELKPGRALDVHMGQGRNALFLAAKGWEVTGFDFSAGGVRAAQEAANKSKLTLSAVVARHEDFDFGRASWDLIVMSYTWVPLRGAEIGRILESLKPGGVLVFEHLMDESGSENAAPWLPRPDELPKIFGGLRILRYEDTRARADWSWRPERIARLVARK